MPDKWVIRNAEIITAAETVHGDISIENEKILRIGPDLPGNFSFELDAKGRKVIPGLVDEHVHFELPVGNRVSSHDFFTGGVAALFGGVTTVIDFTTPFENMSLTESLDERLDKLKKAPVDTALHSVVCGWDANREQEVEACLKQGVTSFKFFTAYKESGRWTAYSELQQAAEFLAARKAVMCIHAEDSDLLRNADAFPDDSFKFYPASRPAEAEAAAIKQLAEIQSRTGVDMVIVHVSSALGLQAAEGTGLRIETCPHYLVLDDSRYREPWGYRFAVAPPLRDAGSPPALWKGIQNGKISTIGTDHCPFTREQQDAAGDHFTRAPFGLAGIETMLPVLVTYGVETGKITWNRLVELTALNPSKTFGLFPRKGTIAPGSDADLVISGNAFEFVEPRKLHGDPKWNPYTGLLMTGFPDIVISRGEIVIADGKCRAEQGRGLFLHRDTRH